MPRPKATKEKIEENFWSKVEKTDSCWNWIANKSSEGYGKFYTIVKSGMFDSELAHRISYWFAYGEFDRSLEVCHKCDNESCVNPNHLFLGTHKDNINDMVNKGRHHFQTNPRKNEEHSQVKLTWEIVRDIRSRYSEGGVTQKELANIYELDRSWVSRIINNKTWVE